MLSTLSILVISCLLQVTHSYRMVCIYTNWSQYRPDKGKFLPENVDPSLCTHLIYVYAKLKNNHLEPSEWNDDSTPWMEGMYSRVNSLKQVNPDLKTLLGVGGWMMGSKDFSRMASRKRSRELFARTAVEFLRERDFDGLAVDWQYPTQRGGRKLDRTNFSLLLKEIKEAFERNSKETGLPRLLLVAGVGASKHIVDSAYEADKVSNYTDFLNVMAYDLHGSWDNFTGHPSPLFPRKDETGPQADNNVDTLMKYWVSKGADPSKLVLGVSSYGRTFTLKNNKFNGYGVPVIGPGEAGDYSKQEGMLAYYERCSLYFDATRVWDDYSKVPHWYSGQQWIGGEDVESIREKVTWVRYNFYGGVMLIPLDMDDFDGRFCGKGEYPLLMAILDQFQVPLTPTTKPSFYMDTDLQPTTDSTTSTIISPDADSASYLYDMTEFSSSDNPSKSSSTVDYTTDSNIDVSTFSSSLYPTTTSTPINLTTSLFDTIRESKSILPEQAFAEGKPDVKFQIITDNKEKTGSTLMKRTEIDTPQISTQKNPARETNQSMTGNETKIDLLVPLHTFDTNRSKPIMNPMNEPRADFALIEPSLTILEAAIPISDMTKFTPALSSSEIAKATDTAIHSGATRTDYKLPDTMTNPETLQTDKTMPISSKYQNNFDKPEHQTTPVDIDKIQSQVRNTERFNEHVSWKSSEHSDPQLEVPVGNKQKYVSPVYSLNNRNDTKFSPIRASPTINVNKRRTSEPQQNARTSLDVPLWGIERGENIQKIDTSYLQSTNTLQNGNSVLDFIHKNGKSKQGRVLSSDTIFKPQITAFSKTFGERERTPSRKITQVMPRFIFPKLTKPQIQTEVIKNNDLRLDLKKATSPGKFSKESISSEETQPGRVRNIPLFEWFQKPLQPLSSGRNKVTNRFNRPLDNQEQNIDRKPTTFGVVRTTQNFPRNPEDKETNFAVANSVIKNKPYMNQLRPMIQTNLPVALSTFDSKQTMKTSSAISTDIDPFQNNDQSRRTDLTNSNDLKKQTSNNLKIKQINDPQRGTISRERPVKHSLQPFKVPSNREATPVLSFFDFKDLGLIVPSA